MMYGYIVDSLDIWDVEPHDCNDYRNEDDTCDACLEWEPTRVVDIEFIVRAIAWPDAWPQMRGLPHVERGQLRSEYSDTYLVTSYCTFNRERAEQFRDELADDYEGFRACPWGSFVEFI